MRDAESNLVSVVVPVYNSVASLAELASRVDKVFSSTPWRYELILVDDGSPNPKTWPALEAVAAEAPRVRALRLTRNFGQQAATLCGLAASAGEFVITMDDDLQHCPEDIPLLLAAAAEHDIVIGQLIARKHGPIKRLLSWVKGWFDVIILDKPLGIRLSAFRVFRRVVVDGMLAIRTPYPFIPALMFYVSRDVVGVPVQHSVRKEGRSNYNFFRLVRMFSNLIITNSSMLLRWVGYAGLGFAVFSAGLVVWLVVRWLLHGASVVGWTSLFVAIMFGSGLSMAALGVMGEYLIRIVAGTENKPMYFVRCERGAGAPSEPRKQDE